MPEGQEHFVFLTTLLLAAPANRIFLVGEIIHNPHVNAKLQSMGITILQPEQGAFDYSQVAPEDVVILPAFGVTIRDFETLRAIGCVVVDTTCGSVLNVWKNVTRYARDGYTVIIHGKHYHEETRATASQARPAPLSTSVRQLPSSIVIVGGGAAGVAAVPEVIVALPGGEQVHLSGYADRLELEITESMLTADLDSTGLRCLVTADERARYPARPAACLYGRARVR